MTEDNSYLGRHGRPAEPTATPAAAAAAYADMAKLAPEGSSMSSSTGQPDSAAPAPAPGSSAPAGAEATNPDALLAAERLADLQRLQAEYVNYKRRVDRDRELQRDLAIAGLIENLLPVLDEIHLARQHGELEGGPFAKIAEKLEAILGKYGVSRYGEPGETFDPAVHEAVMNVQAELAEGTTEPTVVQVLQPGYRLGERVLRAALVAVAQP